MNMTATAKNADYENAVNLLAVLTEAKNQLAALQAQADADFTECIDEHKDDWTKLNQTVTETELSLEIIARRHPEWFADGKTVKTPYGSIAIKENPPKLTFTNEELVMALIEKAGMEKEFIRTTKALNLDTLSGLSDDELAQFRIKRVQGDRFEAKPAKVDLGKAVKSAEARLPKTKNPQAN